MVVDTLMALSGASTPSVIRIRIEGLRGEPLAELVQQIVAHSEDALQQGALITVQAGRMRIRHLPLVPPAQEETE